MQNYRNMSHLGKVFVWFSALIVAAYAVVYAFQVRDALNMKPNSFNCTHDSMMEGICHHPFSSSIIWSLLLLCYFAWPIIAAWAIVGVTLLVRRKRRNAATADTGKKK